LTITDYSSFSNTGPGYPALTLIGRAEHGISRKQISPGCLKVLYALNEAGYQSFVVGGGVRDILLGLTPKDFDVATDATPEQIRTVFRNSRIIGRRFRIVHVHFGREIIEVSTFRALTGDNVEIVEEGLNREARQLDSVQSASGMLLRDNVYGSIEEDVLRRDFTVNALYYTVRDFVVHDYVNGMADLQARCLRMIGDPEQRYREDPVRVLRALRLAAKLDFSIAPDTAAPLQACARLLESVSPARLFDEFIKLFFAGHGARTFELLRKYRVFDVLFPATAALLDKPPIRYSQFLQDAVISTDERINAEKSVTPAFLLAVLLWPAVQEQQALLVGEGEPPALALNEAADIVLSDQLERLAIPRRFSVPMREIWELQLRLPNRRGRRAELLLSHKRFRAAYDFLLLREAAGEELGDLGQWWTEYQLGDPATQSTLLAQLGGPPQSGKTRRRRQKSRRPDQPTPDV